MEANDFDHFLSRFYSEHKYVQSQKQFQVKVVAVYHSDTVSYTHLDVYKRQAYELFLICSYFGK